MNSVLLAIWMETHHLTCVSIVAYKLGGKHIYLSRVVIRIKGDINSMGKICRNHDGTGVLLKILFDMYLFL